MWDYTDKVIDHFTNPRNVGVVPDADGTGEVGNITCGDALKLTIKVDPESKIITEAKFQTFGCGSAIASSSALTIMIQGKHIDEAAKITNRDIADFLGGLPQEKMHCSVMGMEGLEAALADYRGEDAPVGHDPHLDEGEIVCVCFGVTDTRIKRIVSENNLQTVAEVTDYCKAGGGCGGCLDQIADLIAEVRNELLPKKVPVKARKLTNIQKIALVQETIEREIRPVLQSDGGDLELIDIVGDNVLVSLRGSCAGCPSAGITMRDFVTKKLQEFVSESLTVEEVKQ